MNDYSVTSGQSAHFKQNGLGGTSQYKSDISLTENKSIMALLIFCHWRY